MTLFSTLVENTYWPISYAIAAISGVQSAFSACGLLILLVFVAQMIFHVKHVEHRLKIAFSYLMAVGFSVLILHLVNTFSSWQPSDNLLIVSRAYFGVLIGVFVLSSFLHIESLFFGSKLGLKNESPLRLKIHGLIEKVGVYGAVAQAFLTTFLVSGCYLTASQDDLKDVLNSRGVFTTIELLIVHVLFFSLVFVILYAFLLRVDKLFIERGVTTKKYPSLRVVKAVLQAGAAYLIYTIIF